MCKRMAFEYDDSYLCTMCPSYGGAYKGDSGGPLVFNNELVGIAIWAIPCDRGICGPDGYASISYYRSWIEKILILHLKHQV